MSPRHNAKEFDQCKDDRRPFIGLRSSECDEEAKQSAHRYDQRGRCDGEWIDAGKDTHRIPFSLIRLKGLRAPSDLEHSVSNRTRT